MSIVALLVALAFMPHVRTHDPAAAALLEVGLVESAEFRALIDAIDRSDVIVHIERRGLLAHRFAGTTRFVTHAGGVRYLRITLDLGLSGDTAVAVLAHELQHVNEIAQTPWIVDPESLRRFLELAGFATCDGGACFDTTAAIRVGQRVFEDLRSATASHGWR